MDASRGPGRVDEGALIGVAGLVVDMDGVLWRGSQVLPGVPELFAALRRLGLPVVLATNNASRSPRHYVERLGALGIAVAEEEVLTSAVATAELLAGALPAGSTVYAIGGPGLSEALAAVGLRTAGGAEESVAAVVVGIDFELTYGKLADAALCIQRGAPFYGTNPDTSYPAEAGLLPGAGAILAALSACTGATPIVIGKPHGGMFAIAAARLGVPAERVLVVGDRLDTDIAGGRRAGMRTALVTTGVSRPEEADGDARPDLVFDGLPALAAALEAAPRRRQADEAPEHRARIDALRRRLGESAPGPRAMAHMAPPGRRWVDEREALAIGAVPAAALALLYPAAGGITVALTVRNADLVHHGGQVSLPGGRVEPGETIDAAALREAHEELRVPPDGVEVIGRLTPLYIPASGFLVHVVVAWAPARPPLEPAAAEVAEVVEVPLEAFVGPAHRAVGSRELRGRDREVPVFAVGGVEVWGATAMLLAELAEAWANSRGASPEEDA